MKFIIDRYAAVRVVSHPARGAWVEIAHLASAAARSVVAPRKGCVG